MVENLERADLKATRKKVVIARTPSASNCIASALQRDSLVDRTAIVVTVAMMETTHSFGNMPSTPFWREIQTLSNQRSKRGLAWTLATKERNLRSNVRSITRVVTAAKVAASRGIANVSRPTCCVPSCASASTAAILRDPQTSPSHVPAGGDRPPTTTKIITTTTAIPIT